MYNEKEKPTEKQLLVLEDRKKFSIGLVENVDSFSEEETVLKTALGLLTVSGRDLKLEDLSVCEGKAELSGRIDRLVFSEAKEKHGFFRDLFR